MPSRPPTSARPGRRSYRQRAAFAAYAHVIKEDTVSPGLLFLGTEFGLWISLDGGEHWAQYKGNDFPNVPVRDIVVHPRESDLVIAHAWPRHLDHRRHLAAAAIDARHPGAKKPFSCKAEVQQQRLEAQGGWAEGDGSLSSDRIHRTRRSSRITRRSATSSAA